MSTEMDIALRAVQENASTGHRRCVMKHMIHANEQTIGQTEVRMDSSWSPPHVLYQNDRRVKSHSANMLFADWSSFTQVEVAPSPLAEKEDLLPTLAQVNNLDLQRTCNKIGST